MLLEFPLVWILLAPSSYFRFICGFRVARRFRRMGPASLGLSARRGDSTSCAMLVRRSRVFAPSGDGHWDAQGGGSWRRVVWALKLRLEPSLTSLSPPSALLQPFAANLDELLETKIGVVPFLGEIRPSRVSRFPISIRFFYVLRYNQRPDASQVGQHGAQGSEFRLGVGHFTCNRTVGPCIAETQSCVRRKFVRRISEKINEGNPLPP